MTRPKVDPARRQRIAQACDACKRRKQKCNGLQPCNMCSKRNVSCSYDTSGIGSDEQHSPKRRMVHPPSTSSSSVLAYADPQPRAPHYMPQGPQLAPILQDIPSQNSGKPQDPGGSSQQGATKPLDEPPGDTPEVLDNKKQSLTIPESGANLQARGTNFGGQDEEAIVESNPRLLEDPTGRVLYIGDAATLSFLQLIRTYVESVTGPGNPFIMDPRRLKIVENTITLPPNIRRTHLLPDKQTATVLVNSFFTNTNGLIEVFPQKTFLDNLEKCYNDPLSVDPSWLCLLFLTFAIGLVMAAPWVGTPEEKIIQKLRGEVSIGRDGKSYPVDRAELFYLDAKQLADPSTGFEDADFWSIQALTLMAVYMLAVSRRNAAYAYTGMALRSAFALGLHRAETMVIFPAVEQSVRMNVWRSLYVLDRFLSASLGRPTAIRDSDCSGDILTSRARPPSRQIPFTAPESTNFIDGHGLKATVSSCHTIGVVLDKVYSQRKVSTKLAQEIADYCKGWPQVLDDSLHHSQANSAHPAQGIAILHVYLFHYHSITLLTRPFFLFIMNKEEQRRRETAQRQHRASTRMQRFGEACVSASCQSIALIHNALRDGYLPRRNPFVIYFLFASALVALSSQFSNLYPHITTNSSVNNAIDSMQYFSEHDPQASRLYFILTSFRDVVIEHRASITQSLDTNIQSQHAREPQQMTLSQERDNLVDNNYMTSTGVETMSEIPTPGAVVHGRQPSTKSSISPPQPLTSATPLSSTNIDGPQYGPGLKESPLGGLPSPQSSWDHFLELAAGTGDRASEGPESLVGDTEIDFDTLWQWPNADGTANMLNGATLSPGCTTLMRDGLGRGWPIRSEAYSTHQ